MTLRSSWSPNDYSALLSRLHGRGVKWISLQAFACGDPGMWIRHDVELDVDAAVSMAELEYGFGLAASYYFCADSPLIGLSDALLDKRMRQIKRLGHNVSFHVILGKRYPPVSEQLSVLRSRFPWTDPVSLTFHAPDRNLAMLARLPLGAQVYDPIVTQIARYYSDSTGRWRWGHPVDVPDIAQIPVQLLIHPFWWAGKEINVDTMAAPLFLPQLVQRSNSLEIGDLEV